MDRYTLEYDARMNCFVAIPPALDMDAFTLCGNTESEAREFAASVGISLLATSKV
jgi:hypothetical protein